jgi:hypothetical protein
MSFHQHKFSMTGSFLNSNERQNSKKQGQYIKNEPQSPRDFGDVVGDHDSDLKDNKKAAEGNRSNNSPFSSSLMGNFQANPNVSSFVSPYLKAQRHPSFRNE